MQLGFDTPVPPSLEPELRKRALRLVVPPGQAAQSPGEASTGTALPTGADP